MGACLRYLPGFPIALIAFSPDYATAALPVPNLNFNLFNYSFSTRRGARFIREAKECDRLIFSWSDNHDEWMALSIRNEVDGVITDDPKRFLELCASDVVREKSIRFTFKQTALWVFINFLVLATEIVLFFVKGPSRKLVKDALGGLNH